MEYAHLFVELDISTEHRLSFTTLNIFQAKLVHIVMGNALTAVVALSSINRLVYCMINIGTFFLAR